MESKQPRKQAVEAQILYLKELRVKLDSVVKEIPTKTWTTAEMSQALVYLRSCRHWLGEQLSLLGSMYPYPNGANPNSLVVDPRADTKESAEDVVEESIKTAVVKELSSQEAQGGPFRKETNESNESQDQAV